MTLTHDYIRTIFDYDPNTGVVTRLVATARRHKVGEAVGCLHKPSNYLVVRILGKLYKLHVVIWFWMKGTWPKDEIDHWDRNRLNNKWINLREATHAQNMQNRSVGSNNTSGFKGVHFDARTGRWRASIGDTKLGRFEKKSEAVAAYVCAAKVMYGEFAGPVKVASKKG